LRNQLLNRRGGKTAAIADCTRESKAQLVPVEAAGSRRFDGAGFFLSEISGGLVVVQIDGVDTRTAK
jgi:hypothetical protein